MLFTMEERHPVPISQVAQPSDIRIFYNHFGDNTYYADYAGIAKKYRPRQILEIGVRFGYSGIALCWGAIAGGAECVTYIGLDACHFTADDGLVGNEKAKLNFATHLPAVAANFFHVDTQRGLPDPVRHLRFDLVNVDGDHSYEGAFLDMQRTWPLMNPGAIMIVDDTGMEDVKRAIEEFVDNENGPELQWYGNERGFALIRKQE